ncbi:MAG: thermonuclease family protein [Roseiflexus sp.]
MATCNQRRPIDASIPHVRRAWQTIAGLVAVCCFLALTLVAAPGAEAQTTPPTTRQTDEQPSPSPDTLAAPSLPDRGLERATVTRVVDGDTIDVRLNRRTVRVRLIGVDTPETVHPSRPVECFGREASQFLKELLDGQTVLLESDPSQGNLDRYNRLLRFVWLPDGRLVNYAIIAQGYGFEYTYNLPYKYQEQFKAAQRAAREAQTGLWAPDACNGERMSAVATPVPTAPPDSTTGNPLRRSFNNCKPDPNASRAPNAPVAIVNIDKRGETVTLKNVGDTEINLDGWVMCSIKGSQIHQGVGGALKPGETRAFKHTGGKQIWNNRETDPGALYDPQGYLVSYWVER